MQPGDLKHTIMLRRTILTPDGGGGFTTAADDLVPLWAKVEPLNAREKLAAMQTDIAAEYKVTIRTRTDLIGEMQVMWSGIEFEIVDLPIADPREPFMTFRISKLKKGS